MSATNQKDLFKGKYSKPEIITASHGLVRGQLIQSFSSSEPHTVEQYPEFDNPDMAAQIHDTQGAEASMEWLSSEQHQIESAISDTNPFENPFMYAPEGVKPVDVILHYKGLNANKNVAARVYLHGDPSAKSNSEDTKSAEKNSISLKFLVKRDIINGDVQYTRFVKGTPDFATGNDSPFDTNGKGTFPVATSIVTDPVTGSGTNIIQAKFNGTVSTSYTSDTNYFTPTVAPVNGDVWEVISIIKP